MKERGLAVVLVGIAVCLNLVSAVVLKEAASVEEATVLLIGALIMLVVVISLGRVFLWAAIHKRFNVSDSYPLTSLFFPMILVLSVWYGEEIGPTEFVGTAFITMGVFVLLNRTGNRGRPDAAGQGRP